MNRRERSELAAHQRLDFDLLIDCVAGEGSHEVDFASVELLPGRLIHIRPGQVHRFSIDDPYEARLIVMRPIQNRRRWKPGPNVLTLDAQTRSDLDLVLSLLDAESRAGQLSAPSNEALWSLIVSLLDLRAGANEEGASLLERVFGALEELLGSNEFPPRTVSECASALGCSTKTLGRACSMFAGKPPKRVIDEAVALAGQRLLEVGGRSTTEIAHVLGFSELSHFSRFIRRMTGVSPSTLRSTSDRHANQR